MIQLLLWGFAAMVAVALLRVMGRPERIYEYPYFMAAAFGIFILPQAVSLTNEPLGVAPDMIAAVLFAAILCLGACILGAYAPMSREVVGLAAIRVDEGRLFLAGVLFTAIGLVANYHMLQAAQDVEGLWSGRVTLYHFFSSLLVPAFAITLRHALLTGGALPWAVATIAASQPLLAIIYSGRRELAAEMLFTVGLLLFYLFRRAPSRVLLLALGALGTVLIPAIGLYRRYAREAGLASFEHFDPLEVFSDYLDGARVLELRNAAWLMEGVSTEGLYEWGAGYWDEIVFRYVPAQLVGMDFKQSLMFNPAEEPLRLWLWAAGYENPAGSTLTGIGDSFLQFGYFGCLFFVAAAIYFRSLWIASLVPGAAFAQLLYIGSVTAGMRAVTHQTAGFVPDVLFHLVFLGAAVLFASAPSPGRAGREAARSPRPFGLHHRDPG